MTTKIVDTNIFVRFFTKDSGELALKAKRILEDAENGKIALYFDEVIAAELVWLLDSFYEYSRTEIYTKLHDLVSQSWVINPRKNFILLSLELFSSTGLSYIDCWLYTLSKNLNFPLETFDKNLKKLKR